MAIMLEPFRKYATLSGRARRLEYWSFQLLVGVILAALLVWFFSTFDLTVVTATEPSMAITQAQAEMGRSSDIALWAIALFSLFTFLPSLAVSVRRLHDSDKSGWWILLGAIPAGAFVLFIFYLVDGTRGPNRFGPDPKGRAGPIYPQKSG
jgi:uncharacterized membrane protein YhaH (DUF805 family)